MFEPAYHVIISKSKRPASLIVQQAAAQLLDCKNQPVSKY
jgi:hypothetical protein